MKKWAQLDGLGRYVADVPPEYVEHDVPPPFSNWTKDHPGDMPGPGAVYSGGLKSGNEWVNGQWAYDPPLDNSPEAQEQRMRDYIASLNK